MNLLADESIDRQIVERLRQDGHYVPFVAEMGPGIADDVVLARANQEGAMLLTVDKDFGELVFRQRRLSLRDSCPLVWSLPRTQSRHRREGYSYTQQGITAYFGSDYPNQRTYPTRHSLNGGNDEVSPTHDACHIHSSSLRVCADANTSTHCHPQAQAKHPLHRRV